ncbi:MAG: UDP-N-acetylmuramate--L-alanine ligase [Sphingobacteriaceae bacterium]
MRVHFIAIGGSAMHNLAIALAKKGYQVSGSDDVINEPSRSRLARFDILPGEMGWYPEKITPELDAVILGMHARVDNPELLKAQELGLAIYSYPEYIYEQSKNKTRVVIGGSHGKTTITSMILHVLQEAGKDFDYLVGAQLEGFDTMVKITKEAPIIVIEGDEYLASPIDRRPKFHLYQGHIGVISGIAWDHINVFPTWESYIKQFDLFIDTLQPGGTLIYCEEDEALKQLVQHKQTEIQKLAYNLPAFSIENGTTYLQTEQGGTTALQIFGDHNLMNLEAARNVCEKLGISKANFYQAIASFKGAARRLELLGKTTDCAVYKDFAHSPSKLKATIHAVKQQFPERDLISAIELHTFSSLNAEFLKEYAGTMNEADVPIVIIDQNTFRQKQMEPFKENVVKKSFNNDKLKFFDNFEIFETYLTGNSFKNTNFLLMSSGNFGGIDLQKLANKLLKI